MTDPRLIDLQHWLKTVLPSQSFKITTLAGDASFRRYFRIHLPDKTMVAMDAPPTKENSQPFYAIANAFASVGIQVPQILAANLEHGFLLLSDLGDDLYLSLLTSENVNDLYNAALTVLQKIQSCRDVPGYSLPHFNRELFSRELKLFPDWFLNEHLSFSLNNHQQHLLATTFEILIESALKQPQVCVHRDYHSRNLLWVNNSFVGVLDFQDAVLGPITYDAVSLLRDCYIAWPEKDVEQWVVQYYENTREKILLQKHSLEEFTQWFDWIGVQRHIKVIGIFSRLCYRDKKENYLNDIPRIFNYLINVCDKYVELKPLRDFLLQLEISGGHAALCPPYN